MQNKIYIKEIFTSIQGEGNYIGYSQLFIRFSKCNLNCKYCDTDFKTDLKPYNSIELANIVNNTKYIHSVSLTGGEPLLDVVFLSEFLPLVNKKIYLETNGTLFENLSKIINYIDFISMDIKLDSSSFNGNLFNFHEKFINVAIENKKEIFVKTVFDENITEDEIKKIINLISKYNIPLILQPKTEGETINISSTIINDVFNKFNNQYQNVRLIAQMHKFINVQ